MSTSRPWVTGIGLLTPIGRDPESFWDSLIQGRSGADSVRSFDTSLLPNTVGCEVVDFAVPDELRDARLGGRCTDLALLAVRQAVERAGLGSLEGASAAVVVGTTMGEVSRFEQDRAGHPDREPGPDDVRSLVDRPLDVMGRAIGRMLGIRGPVVTVPAACAAGSYAVAMASSLVRRRQVEIAIAVGCEAFSRLAFVGFTRMRAMSADFCRPFSRNRRGLLLGEGAAAIVVESTDRIRKRGAVPLARISGYGLSCDAHHITGPHPEGAGAVRAMRGALADARLASESIDYVNAHGTGTLLNDRTESRAVREVLGPDVPLSSIKALTGHMMGASGAAEAIASVLAMHHGVIPPTCNWEAPDPECPVDCVPNEPRPAKLTHVMSNSYAFGGNNASLILSAPGA